jgi:hypothetical protein
MATGGFGAGRLAARRTGALPFLGAAASVAEGSATTAAMVASINRITL